MVDVDDTLIMWDVNSFDKPTNIIDVHMYGYVSTLVPNKPNIELLKKFRRLGYDIIVWSQTGYDWAEAIVKALDLESYVSAYATKPKFYMDDLDSGAWMGKRIWKDPTKEYSLEEAIKEKTPKYE